MPPCSGQLCAGADMTGAAARRFLPCQRPELLVLVIRLFCLFLQVGIITPSAFGCGWRSLA
eukprot:113947-Pyramimonas_sp.AAC.1